MDISKREQKIISIILEKGQCKSSHVHAEMLIRGDNVSLLTIKRALSAMLKKNIIVSHGQGRALSYDISVFGRVFSDIDARAYCITVPDRRFGLRKYNFELFSSMPADIFTDSESRILEDATAEYARRTKDLPPAIRKRELET